MKSNRNIFLTGKAGTGKSYILREYLSWAYDNNISVAVTASTGISALNINGQTIHSFIRTGGSSNIDEYKRYVNKYGKARLMSVYEKISSFEVVIIDEVSMLSSKMLDLIDYVFKQANHNVLPFGGVKMIFVGDFLQLPPIGKTIADRRPAFRSKAWREANIYIYNLDKVYRQKDDEFINVLSNIRHGDRRGYINNYFDDIQLSGLEDLSDYKDYIRLCGTNKKVSYYNNLYLDLLEGHMFEYEYKATGNNWYKEELLKNSNVEETLFLKLHSRVMFIANDSEGRYANGTTGTIFRLNDDLIKVKLDNGEIVTVDKHDWMQKDGSGQIRAKVKQYPLKLANAITIHKSQGLTLKKVIVDCEDIFEEGQLYTALSRCESKDELLLDGFDVWVQNKTNKWAIKLYDQIEGIDKEILDDIKIKNVYGFVKIDK